MSNVKLIGNVEIGKVYERPWGRYIVLEFEGNHLVKRIEVDPGRRFSLQLHNRRSEIWTIVSGRLKVTLDDRQFEAGVGEVVQINIRQIHRAECISNATAVFIEVQHGDYLAEDDIVRFEDDYGRI